MAAETQKKQDAQTHLDSKEPGAYHKPMSVDDLTRQNVETIAQMERVANQHRKTGERVADSVAAVIGSWTFIIIQTIILAAWLTLNVVAWIRHWDPYPFILLNLGLSFQAAYSSPIIMMSQNRQQRLADRRNHLDLQINLLSEQENTKMLAMLEAILKHLDIPDGDPEVGILEESTQPDRLLQQIEACVEEEDTNGKEDNNGEVGSHNGKSS